MLVREPTILSAGYLPGGPGSSQRQADLSHLPALLERLKREARAELRRLAHRPLSDRAEVRSLRAMIATPIEQIVAEIAAGRAMVGTERANRRLGQTS